MTVTVEGYDPNLYCDVMIAAEEASAVEIQRYTIDKRTYLYGDGETSLSGGQTEQQYADAVAKAVWVANGGKYCHVKVTCCYLENPPMYVMDQSKFDQMKEVVNAKVEALETSSD